MPIHDRVLLGMIRLGRRDRWLRSDEPLLFETRDEGLLKLFLSDGMSAAEKAALIRAMRTRHEEVVASLESTKSAAADKGGGPYDVLRYGLAFHRFCADQLAQMEAEVMT